MICTVKTEQTYHYQNMRICTAFIPERAGEGWFGRGCTEEIPKEFFAGKLW